MLTIPYITHEGTNVWKFCSRMEWKFLMLWTSSIPDGTFFCSSWFHEKVDGSTDIFFRLVVSKNGTFHYEVSKMSNVGQYIRGNNGLYRIMFEFYATDYYNQPLPEIPDYFWMDMGYLKYKLSTILKSKMLPLPFEEKKVVTVRVTMVSMRSAHLFHVMEHRVLKNFEVYVATMRSEECMTNTVRTANTYGNLGKDLLKQTVEDNSYCDLCVETLSSSGLCEYLYAHKCVLYQYSESEPFRRLFLVDSVVLMHYWPRSVVQVLFSLIYTGRITWRQLDTQEEQIWWNTTEIPWFYLASFAHMYELENIFMFAVVNAFKRISIPYSFSPYSRVKMIKDYTIFLYHLNLPQLAERYLTVLEFLNVDCEEIPCSEGRKIHIRNRKVKSVCVNNCKCCYTMNRNYNDDERYLILQ